MALLKPPATTTPGLPVTIKRLSYCIWYKLGPALGRASLQTTNCCKVQECLCALQLCKYNCNIEHASCIFHYCSRALAIREVNFTLIQSWALGVWGQISTSKPKSSYIYHHISDILPIVYFLAWFIFKKLIPVKISLSKIIKISFLTYKKLKNCKCPAMSGPLVTNTPSESLMKAQL